MFRVLKPVAPERFSLRVVPRICDLHCDPVLDAFGEGMVVMQAGIRLVVGAPCHQQGHVGQQAQLTGRPAGHPSTPVDDRAGGLKERLPLLLVGQTA